MYQAMGNTDGMKQTQQQLLELTDAIETTPAAPLAAAATVAEPSQEQSSMGESLGDSTGEVIAGDDF
jgi:hypothetical protein